jgi:hypothetical protein
VYIGTLGGTGWIVPRVEHVRGWFRGSRDRYSGVGGNGGDSCNQRDEINA